MVRPSNPSPNSSSSQPRPPVFQPSPPPSSNPWIRRSETVEAADELYVHHSDNPSSSLSTTPLDERNYVKWRRSVEVSLTAKHKIGFVTGSCPKPPSDSPLCAQWERCSNMVISWLLHSVKKEIADSVLFCRTARQIWTELATRFNRPTRTKLYQCKILWDEYSMMIENRACICGSTVVASGLLQDQQEEQRSIRSPESQFDEDGTALASRGGGSSRRGGSNGGRSYFCDYCKRSGHTIDRCYRLHGYPNRDLNSDSHREQRHDLPRDQRVAATSLEQASSPTLSSTSSAPKITQEQYDRLMSLLSQKSDELKILLLSSQASSMKKPLLIGKEDKGLYVIDRSLCLQASRVVTSSSLALSFISPKCLELWHCSLGHVAFDQLKCLPFIAKDATKAPFLCTVCHQSKQHRKSFPTSIKSTFQASDLIHIDT